MADQVSYSAFDLSTLPKRVTSRTDIEAANGLLSTVQSNGAASDSLAYETREQARNAGLRASRLLEHVAPAGKIPSIRTFGIDKKGTPTNTDPAKYGWMVTLKDEKEAEADAEAEAAAE